MGNNMNVGVFAKRFKQAREKSGMSLDQLAIKCDTTKATLWKYEQADRVPKLPIAKKIAEVLNISFDWLIGYSEEFETFNFPKIQEVYSKLSLEAKKQVIEYATFLLEKESKE